MKITIERSMAPADIDTFYGIYVTAFDPLRTRAAARHLLSAQEFAAEMTDERIEKYVAWSAEGQPIALTTLTGDLAAVPWVSPDYYAARYPEHFARGALFYLGYTLVHPDHERHGVFARIAARIVRRCTEARAVCAFDVCGHNDDVHQIGRSIAALSRSLDMKVETADVQTYYAAVFNGPKVAA
ncbi:MAG: hypothetical protein AUG44_27310 [Actinobacteria bacterium 13_1_20CM_3_71_11]|nr:MAG: hypothetical protein AUG44_27310 [Actinobacteria bacterium 13_1_20CM_3_71_11]